MEELFAFGPTFRFDLVHHCFKTLRCQGQLGAGFEVQQLRGKARENGIRIRQVQHFRIVRCSHRCRRIEGKNRRSSLWKLVQTINGRRQQTDHSLEPNAHGVVEFSGQKSCLNKVRRG